MIYHILSICNVRFGDILYTVHHVITMLRHTDISYSCQYHHDIRSLLPGAIKRIIKSSEGRHPKDGDECQVRQARAVIWYKLSALHIR
jgi:hypothetical protein